MSTHAQAVETTAHPHHHHTPTHHTGPEPDAVRKPWTVFAFMIAAQFMVILDVSVVNVAMPDRKARRRSNRSAMRPPSSNNPPDIST